MLWPKKAQNRKIKQEVSSSWGNFCGRPRYRVHQVLQLLHKLGNGNHITMVHKQVQTMSWSVPPGFNSKEFLKMHSKGTEGRVLASAAYKTWNPVSSCPFKLLCWTAWVQEACYPTTGGGAAASVRSSSTYSAVHTTAASNNLVMPLRSMAAHAALQEGLSTALLIYAAALIAPLPLLSLRETLVRRRMPHPPPGPPPARCGLLATCCCCLQHWWHCWSPLSLCCGAVAQQRNRQGWVQPGDDDEEGGILMPSGCSADELPMGGGGLRDVGEEAPSLGECALRVLPGYVLECGGPGHCRLPLHRGRVHLPSLLQVVQALHSPCVPGAAAACPADPAAAHSGSSADSYAVTVAPAATGHAAHTHAAAAAAGSVPAFTGLGTMGGGNHSVGGARVEAVPVLVAGPEAMWLAARAAVDEANWRRGWDVLSLEVVRAAHVH